MKYEIIIAQYTKSTKPWNMYAFWRTIPLCAGVYHIETISCRNTIIKSYISLQKIQHQRGVHRELSCKYNVEDPNVHPLVCGSVILYLITLLGRVMKIFKTHIGIYETKNHRRCSRKLFQKIQCRGIFSCAGVYCINTISLIIRWSNDNFQM